MARPSKLTAKLQREICRLLDEGVYLETAAAASGVHRSTVYDWITRGEADIDSGSDTLHSGFVVAVDEARARAELADLRRQRDDPPGEWQKAAWRLERRSPERWGVKQRVEHAGKDAGPIEIRFAFDPEA